MSEYVMVYGHNESDSPGRLTMDATTDTQAVSELRKFVEDGFRNGTYARVSLADGRSYGARNEHGNAVGGYVEQGPL